MYVVTVLHCLGAFGALPLSIISDALVFLVGLPKVSLYYLPCRSRRLVMHIACSIDGFDGWFLQTSTKFLTRVYKRRGALVFLPAALLWAVHLSRSSVRFCSCYAWICSVAGFGFVGFFIFLALLGGCRSFDGFYMQGWDVLKFFLLLSVCHFYVLVRSNHVVNVYVVLFCLIAWFVGLFRQSFFNLFSTS